MPSQRPIYLSNANVISRNLLLITGATGFLGRHLIDELTAVGYPLRAIVRPQSDVAYLREKRVELFYAEDIADDPAVAQACVGCRSIIHAAGRFRFWGDYPAFWQTNVGGTAAVLAGAAAAGVEKVVLVSTVAVVGRPSPGRVVDEHHPIGPQDPYQRTKWEAEQLALRYAGDGRLPVVIVRPGAFYGPWGQYAFNRLFFEEPLRGWRVQVDGGRHLTFPVFVPDVARGICLALKKGRSGEIYNLSGPSLTHQAINDIVSDLAGIGRWRLPVPGGAMRGLARAWTLASRFTRREPFYPINMAPYVFDDWAVSSAKAERELGFTATPFPAGAATTLDWYRSIGLLPHHSF